MKQNAVKTQEDEIKRIWRDYLNKQYVEIMNYPGAHSKMHHDKVMSRSYITTRARVTAPFRSSVGSNQVSFIPAFNQIIKHLIDNGVIQIMPRQQVQTLYGVSGECYALLDTKWLLS